MKFYKFLFVFVLAVAAFCLYAEQQQAEIKKLTPRDNMNIPSINRGGESYRIIVLGDVHYDGAEYHHHLSEKWKKIIKAIPRNIEMWESRMGKLLSAAKSQATSKTEMVIQIGDLVEGNCGNGEAHVKMVTDAINFMDNFFGEIPFYFCAGNHDYNGDDAQAAFDKAALPYYSKMLGKKVASRSYYFTVKNDLFIFTDYNNPDLAMIEKALQENSEARYKFLVTHGSVIPSDLPTLHGYFLSKDVEKYNCMRDLLLKNEVIVLSGHSHVCELIDCVAQEGRLTQITLDSRWTPAYVIEKSPGSTTPQQYGRRQKTPEKIAEYAKYQGVIKEFYQNFTAAYAILDINNDGIVVNFYVGDKLESKYCYKLR
ncbi:MAG: metallophosphoesterase [Lentisphaeria bacterium]|nr:metallophosphoesterase [Lentisphaeria bacterium]